LRILLESVDNNTAKVPYDELMSNEGLLSNPIKAEGKKIQQIKTQKTIIQAHIKELKI
jgi:hypothetical protein